MARKIGDAVREVCLQFPEAEEFLSHGSPNFRVRGGKVFASYAVNIHGDGRVALWLNVPDGVQAIHVDAEPEHYFVPPYVGPRGWLGVRLDRGISWKRVAALARLAYEQVAPARLTANIGRTLEIEPPKAALPLADIDPLQAPKAKRVIDRLRRLCLALPETNESTQFGAPVWRAGNHTFVQAYHEGKRLVFGFWVGAHRQSLLTCDPRYFIPPYMGHNGWIGLRVDEGCDWDEVRSLMLESYRHFALQRMLKALPAA
jgi:hypothetical protein